LFNLKNWWTKDYSLKYNEILKKITKTSMVCSLLLLWYTLDTTLFCTATACILSIVACFYVACFPHVVACFRQDYTTVEHSFIFHAYDNKIKSIKCTHAEKYFLPFCMISPNHIKYSKPLFNYILNWLNNECSITRNLLHALYLRMRAK